MLLHAFGLLLCAALASDAVEIDLDGLKDPPGDPATTALAKDKPWVPGWCRWDWRSAWLSQYQAHRDRTRQGGIDIVFYGDSITAGWTGDGKEVWDRVYAPLKAVDYGIGGDSTRQLIWRLLHGEVDGLMPTLVVLKIGTNNLYDDANGGSDEEIAQGITTVVRLLRKRLPTTKILLLGLLPRQNDWFCGRVARINGLIKLLDDKANVRYLDIGARFLAAPGKVKPELYNQDQLHLVKAGYEAWAAAMQPLFDELLK